MAPPRSSGSVTTADLPATVTDLTRADSTVAMATHGPLAAAAADRVLHLQSGTVASEEVAGWRPAVIGGNGGVQLRDPD